VLVAEVNFVRRYVDSYIFSEGIVAISDLGFEAVDILNLPSRRIKYLPISHLDLVFVRSE
jgi:hypothetical protein